VGACEGLAPARTETRNVGMTPNRFQEAKRLYNSALEREPVDREAYLAEACGGDELLRQEVESLFNCRSEAQEFFKLPAVQARAAAVAREGAIDLSGRTVSHYEIREKIDKGGMGIVYKARDTHLDRFVALKVLPPDRVADPERKRRFVQEAKAASALNHPNIVTIHDIDTAEGVTFIAMEFVSGRTLDRLIRGQRFVLRDILKHGLQIADALAAAHAAGIIHRDIKPANIMITDSGLVKVLDFGLAKLTDRIESSEIEGIRSVRPRTEEGLLLGTVAYMSPEQAEGKHVDARSDIFSFGSLLYEMTTGQRAFSGETNASTLAAILRDEPKPLRELALAIPQELDRLITRCLRKQPTQRFPQMADVKAALEELKQESDSGTRLIGVSRATRPRRALAWTVIAVLLTAALGLAAWFEFFRRPAARTMAKVSALTALPGIQTQPALSPDGKQLAFVWNGEKQDNYDIYIQLVGDATPRRLTTSPAFDYSPVWSPDALHIAFLRDTPAGAEVIIIPAGGGAEETVRVSAAQCGWWGSLLSSGKQYCGIAWSPNGRFLTIVDKERPQAPNSIFLLDLEKRETRNLTRPPAGFEDGLSVFSPDGRSLAFARRPGLPLSDIYVLSLSDSGQPLAEPRQITGDNTFIYGFDWSGDGSNLLFSSSRGGLWGLWRVAASGGTPERLAIGGDDALFPSISRSRNLLAFSLGGANSHVWRVAAPDGGYGGAMAAPMRITHSSRHEQEPVFSPDGQHLAWVSMQSGEHQIWVCRTDGSMPAQRTKLAPPGADAPRWSPDGRLIAFRGFSPWPTHVYVIAADGGEPRRVTTGDFREGPPVWSSDGKWIYFSSNRGDGDAIWKAPAGGGSPVLVARKGSSPVASSDGRFVYYEGPGATVWKAPSDGGPSVLLARNAEEPLFETGDGKYLYFSGRGRSIWKTPAAGGEAVQVLRIGMRAEWTVARTGIYILDPDAPGGPAIEFATFAGMRRGHATLPDPPDNYFTQVGVTLAASPDGHWITYLYQEQRDVQIMLAENFR
jgi:Tol biopolymer transport system component/predicted Ser/Thr protein kinase